MRALLAATVLAALGAGSTALAAVPSPKPDDGAPARTVPFALVNDRDVNDRRTRPEDRYAVAGGCYTLEAPGAGYVARRDGALVLTQKAAEAVALHFQPTRLGEYLLATNEGRDDRWEGAWWDVRGYAAAAPALPSLAPGPVVAAEPSPDAEWRIVAAGENPEAKAKGNQSVRFAFSVPSRDAVLVARDGGLRLAPATEMEPTALTLRHVADDDPADGDPNGAACATWPEIETGASGKPLPVAKSDVDRARGFFEAHVHGMAFEFLGGELRCGRPWHPYGVEHALGNCYEEGNPFNAVLEVAVAGQSPADPVSGYDPVGWPTFAYWPQHDTLTHEQFYWRWLERAHAGGLRLLTNLLVDNTALCQVFPVKRNSCNEMDGVRLQAQRLFELQEYIDAQSGGPGEGWLRIVTTPAQARRTINAGRLAVVLGIEVSVLFDCNEILDQPQCTAQQIDDRLQEVFDMGVRQMELVNKFDNALSGVTGDGGETGVVVNTGNRWVTGHWWDMRTCASDAHTHGLEGDEHDKTQLTPASEAPEGIDALAGRVLNAFGDATKGAVAPLYPRGPHCNSRGLTPLGRHLIQAMVEKGMIFDPDHMSSRAQAEALDLLEAGWRAEQQSASAQRRPAVRPAVVSSHSWANDVVYQRIYGLDGTVAPRTRDAAGFVASWKEHAEFARRNAPDSVEFGLGYGADTNGLGGQPGPRREPGTPLTYTADGFPAPIGGVRLAQQRSGVKTYDVNRDGVAHYGLFADWYRELALAADELAAAQGGATAILDDMLDAPESYLQMWERAVYGGGDCVRDGSSLQPEDLHAALGLNLEGFLRAVGQPVTREGAAYTYCVEDGNGGLDLVNVRFDGSGVAASARAAGPANVDGTSEAASSAATGRAAAVVDGHGSIGHAAHHHRAPSSAGASAAGVTGGADRPLPMALAVSATAAGGGALLLLVLGPRGRRRARRIAR